MSTTLTPQEWEELESSGFDGHTEFEALTPLQRLQWLAQAVRFWHLAQGLGAAADEDVTGVEH